MMNIQEEIINLSNEDSITLKYLNISDCVWFMGSDVAKEFGYTVPRHAISQHIDICHKKSIKDLLIQFYKKKYENEEINRCDVGVLLQDVHTSYIEKEVDESLYKLKIQATTIFITEAGVNELILNSNLKKAKDFRKKLVEEVIPQIARTGKYDPTYKMQNNKIIPNEETKQMVQVDKNEIQNMMEMFMNNQKQLIKENKDEREQLNRENHEERESFKIQLIEVVKSKDQEMRNKEKEFKTVIEQVKNAVEKIQHNYKTDVAELVPLAITLPTDASKIQNLFITLKNDVEMQTIEFAIGQDTHLNKIKNNNTDEIIYNGFLPNPLYAVNNMKEGISKELNILYNKNIQPIIKKTRSIAFRNRLSADKIKLIFKHYCLFDENHLKISNGNKLSIVN